MDNDKQLRQLYVQRSHCRNCLTGIFAGRHHFLMPNWQLPKYERHQKHKHTTFRDKCILKEVWLSKVCILTRWLITEGLAQHAVTREKVCVCVSVCAWARKLIILNSHYSCPILCIAYMVMRVLPTILTVVLLLITLNISIWHSNCCPIFFAVF